MRILSGIQPSGKLHLGNYFGMMSRMIEYQKNHELFCFIVNLHALTSVFDPETLKQNTLAATADFLSLGLDPEKSYFWVQSDVTEVTELTWYLSNITPFGLLERCTSYKDKVDKGIPASHGLFSYPVLMAADILLFQADKVPVGKDQKQHLEMARDIAEKFNRVYGETFKIPEPDITRDSAVVPGLDGQKMSKSYDNTIEIFLPEKELKKKIMSIKTDSKTVEEPKNPDENVIHQIYKLFVDPDQAGIMAEQFRKGNYGYGQAKQELYKVVSERFAPLREKREKLFSNPSYLKDILQMGAKKARAIAADTLEKVREKVGVVY
ncbi:MAG: tryptophan--tRNA ligase [Candidatus Aureabacteria bacterium]|nr:tryptophan--tRNA ligase [Candidatus Auribacterota bacterium]